MDWPETTEISYTMLACSLAILDDGSNIESLKDHRIRGQKPFLFPGNEAALEVRERSRCQLTGAANADIAYRPHRELYR